MKYGFIGIIFVRKGRSECNRGDHSGARTFPRNRRAVKNCYPRKNPRPSPAQNASADSNGVRPHRSVLIVVNKSHSRRFDPLSQPLV